jgi:competence protein ComGA
MQKNKNIGRTFAGSVEISIIPKKGGVIWLSKIERLADSIVCDAVRRNASDIHILPRRHDTLVQLRIADRLISRQVLPTDECERLISHFKFSASMDIGDRRRPQSGAYSLEIDQKLIGLRLSTLPSSHHESLVIRILPQEDNIHISKISLFPAMSNKLLALLKHAHGLVLFTGPTGSGKTTTLYSLLHETSSLFKRNVITLEDPIEKDSDLVLQVQVNEKAGVSYASGLKAILRHDPDIIMVGEIRDAETAEIAVRAALTGHLVLSTMHTRDARGAIYRLSEFGIGWQEIEQTLIAVTAQRLVELSCPYCSGTCPPHCRGAAAGKRASVFELLTGKALSAVMKEARGEGSPYQYPTLRNAILKGIALGYIKEAEMDRWVYNEDS